MEWSEERDRSERAEKQINTSFHTKVATVEVEIKPSNCG